MCNNNRLIKNTPFGEPDHTAETPMEERFDRISKENYERIDREVMSGIDEIAQYERKPRFFYAFLHILEFILVGCLVGCTVAVILRLITT